MNGCALVCSPSPSLPASLTSSDKHILWVMAEAGSQSSLFRPSQKKIRLTSTTRASRKTLPPHLLWPPSRSPSVFFFFFYNFPPAILQPSLSLPLSLSPHPSPPLLRVSGKLFFLCLSLMKGCTKLPSLCPCVVGKYTSLFPSSFFLHLSVAASVLHVAQSLPLAPAALWEDCSYICVYCLKPVCNVLYGVWKCIPAFNFAFFFFFFKTPAYALAGLFQLVRCYVWTWPGTCGCVCAGILYVSSHTGSETPPDLLIEASQWVTVTFYCRLRLFLCLHLCNESHVSFDFGGWRGKKDDGCHCEGGPSVFKPTSW